MRWEKASKISSERIGFGLRLLYSGATGALSSADTHTHTRERVSERDAERDAERGGRSREYYGESSK